MRSRYTVEERVGVESLFHYNENITKGKEDTKIRRR